MAATIAAPSSPGTRSSSRARSSSSSSTSGDVKLASWSARRAAHSLPGDCSRAATIARQARAVALTRGFGAGANGIP